MKKLTFLLASFFLQAYCLGQEIQLPQVIPPAPEAAALGKYGEIPVSLNVGIPQISIPLYEITGQQLSLPISLQYYSQGFKPSEVASCVGLGWTLQAGGVITRVVKGWPDEFPNGFYNTLPKYLNNIWGTSCDSKVNGVSDEACQWRIKAISGELDLEPDEYYFNFNNYAGHFMINENKEIVGFPDQNLKIEHDDLSDIWIITTPDGIIYLFDRREISLLNNGPYCSAWYLTEIKAPDNDVIYFEYELNGNEWERNPPPYQTFTIVEPPYYLSPIVNPHIVDINGIITDTSCNYPASSSSRSEISSTTVNYLTQISYPRRGIEVNLEYQNDRRDTESKPGNSLRRLSKITVTSQMYSPKEVIRNYELDNNNYFGNTTDANNTVQILKLSAITETLSQTKHTFKYNEYASLPGYDSPNYDYWGFYNGASNRTTIPAMPLKYSINYKNSDLVGANREPSSDSQACMLNEITYPTGGYTQFLWEPNIVTYENINVDTKKMTNNTCTSGSFSMNPQETQLADYLNSQYFDDTNMPVNVHITSFIFKSDYPYMSFDISLAGTNQTGFIKVFLYKADDSIEEMYFDGRIIDLPVPIVNIFAHPDFKQIPLGGSQMEMKQGTYLLITVVSKNSNNMSISVSGSYVEKVLLPYLDKLAGGVRIAKITTNDGINPQNTIVKTFDYTKDFQNPKLDNSVRSSGKLFLDPYYDDDVSYSYFDQCKRLIMTSHPVDNLGFPVQIKRGHIGYSEVTEIINNKVGGFVTTHFKNEEEYYSRNLVLSEKTYDLNQKIVKSIENKYKAACFRNMTTRMKIWFKKTLTETITIPEPYGNDEVFTTYDLEFGESLPNTIPGCWYGISEKKENLYSGNDSITSITQYEYDGLVNNENNRHFFPTRIKSQMSDGSLHTKQMRYAMDFNSPNSFISVLQSKYANKLIEEQDYQNSTLISSVYTKYSNKANPNEIYRCNLSKLNAPGLAPDGDLANNTFYEKYISFQRDAVFDNILTQNILDATFKSYIWGYNNSLPVVKIENLEYSNIPSNVINQISQYSFSNSCNPDSINEDILFMKNQLATIGANKLYLITLFTYKSAVGITSMTAPNGITTYYNYDSFGRLIETYYYENNDKSKKRKVETYEYHYRD